jgi:hypothetical protein
MMLQPAVQDIGTPFFCFYVKAIDHNLWPS